MTTRRARRFRAAKPRWMRQWGFPVHLAGCALWIALATALFGGSAVQNNLVWIANGVLLSYLLLAPRWRWPSYLLIGFHAQIAGSEARDFAHFGNNALLSALNVLEVVIGASLLRRRSAQLPQFTHLGYLVRFLGYAVLLSPIAVGMVFAALSSLRLHGWAWRPFELWVTTDGLGTMIAAPACVAVFQNGLRIPGEEKLHWICAVLFLAVTFAAFAQPGLPILFLIYPVVALILFRFGIGWAATATLMVAAIGNWFTVRGLGPFSKAIVFVHASSATTLQLYVAAGMFMIFAASTVLDNLREAEQKLWQMTSLQELVLDNSRDIIILADFDGHRSYVSPSVLRWGAWSPEELLRHKSLELVHPEDQPKIAATIQQLRGGVEEALIECRVRNRDGGYFWVEASLRLVRDPVTRRPKGVLNMVRDISIRKAVEKSRDFHLSLIGAIHEVSLDGILVVNGDGNVVSYNKRFSEVWGISAPDIPASMLGSKVELSDSQLLSQAIDHTKDPDAFLERVRQLYAHPEEDDHCHVELKDGRTLERYSTCLRNDDGQTLGRVWFFRDITAHISAEAELREAYRALEALAVTDPLTHLANRRRLDQCLTNEWRRGMRERLPLSLLLIDVDLFKSYNDTYGHLRGDSCLKQVAEAAQDVVCRPSDLVARFGGEEFAIVLPNTPNEGAMEVAEMVCAAIRQRKLAHSTGPLGILTVSIGCATLVPGFGQHAATLIQKADDALYSAKNNGRNRVCNANQHEQAAVQQAS